MAGELKPAPELAAPKPEKREAPPETKKVVVETRTAEPLVTAKPEKGVAEVASPAPREVVSSKDATHMVIERVLEDGLRDTFFALPTERRQAFRDAGEKLASQIRALVGQKNVRPRLVQRQVERWLRIIPQVDANYLTQASVIKTGRLLEEIHGDEEMALAA